MNGFDSVPKDELKEIVAEHGYDVKWAEGSGLVLTMDSDSIKPVNLGGVTRALTDKFGAVLWEEAWLEIKDDLGYVFVRQNHKFKKMT